MAVKLVIFDKIFDNIFDDVFDDVFCRGSHHGSQIGQSRNSVKFASPTHHRYSAASDNIGNLMVMMMMMMLMMMATLHPTTDTVLLAII